MTKDEDKKKKEIALKIFDLNTSIDREILSGEDDLPETVKALRHRILYVHSVIESQIDAMINIKLYFVANTEKDEEFSKKIDKILEFRKLINPMTDQITFSRKVRIAVEMGLIDKNLEKLANQLNDIRNKLSHVRNNTPSPYASQESQYEALETASNVLKQFQDRYKQPTIKTEK